MKQNYLRLFFHCVALMAAFMLAPAYAQMSIQTGSNPELEKVMSPYVVGQTSWEGFTSDGWFEIAPTSNSLGLIKAVGSLDKIVMIVLSTYNPDTTAFEEQATQDRPAALERLNAGAEGSYDPGYITGSKDFAADMPANCILRFEERKLIQKRCLFL